MEIIDDFKYFWDKHERKILIGSTIFFFILLLIPCPKTPCDPCSPCPACPTCETCEVCPSTSEMIAQLECPVCDTPKILSINDTSVRIDSCEYGELSASFKQSSSFLLKDNIYDVSNRLWRRDKRLNVSVTGCSDDFGCLTCKMYSEDINDTDKGACDWV